jgi:hypothetical protein
LFLSFVSFTAAAVASFIRQLDEQERAAEGGTWLMKDELLSPFKLAPENHASSISDRKI